jgi:hypothetical protein
VRDTPVPAARDRHNAVRCGVVKIKANLRTALTHVMKEIIQPALMVWNNGILHDKIHPQAWLEVRPLSDKSCG